MIVLYEQGLERIAAELSAMGMDMRPMKGHICADAVLYLGDVHGALSVRACSRGAPLLCVRGMSSAQIFYAIKRRSAEPLF